MEPVKYLNKKFILLFVFVCCLKIANGQVYQLMPQYGYDAKRMKFDSTLQIPTFCGVPRLASAVTKNSAIAFDSCGGKFYFYNPTSKVWDTIKGGGTGSTPTLQQVTDVGNTTSNNISVSNGFGAVALYTDESIGGISMQRIDTSNNISFFSTITPNEWSFFHDNSYEHYLQIRPHINALTTYNYLPDTTGTLAVSVNGNFADTKGNITISSIDTTSLSNRINAKADTSAVKLKLNISDTSNKWVSNVVSISDSAFRVIKGSTNTDITIKSVSTSVSTTKLITTVWNNTGANILPGQVIYINGAHSSNLPTIALAKSNNEATSAYTYGLAQDTIFSNKSGIVVQNGVVNNLNLPTSSYTDGQTLYLSPTIAGGYTTTKPTAPNHYVAIGTITRAHPVFGQIQVAIRNGFQLDEMSDVKISAIPADSTLLQFSRVDSLWHDVPVTTAIGGRYIKPSDTSTMLSPYLRKSDTASLSSRINLRVLISDTATMLSPYLRKRDTASLSSRIDAKVGGSGTTGSIPKYTASTTLGNATVDVDYLQQDMSMVAMQAMGSSIKGYSVGGMGIADISTSLSPSNQTLYLSAVYIPKSVTLTGVRWYQVTNGVFNANNYNGVGLYTISGGTLTLVASSTNDTSTFKQGGSSWQSKAFSSTYSAAGGTIVYAALLYSSSSQTTAPALGTVGSSAGVYAAINTFDFTNSQRFFAGLASQTSLPSSITLSSTTANIAKIVAYLY